MDFFLILRTIFRTISLLLGLRLEINHFYSFIKTFLRFYTSIQQVLLLNLSNITVKDMYNVPKGLQFKQILSIQRILGGKKSTNIKQKYFMIIKMIINNRAVIIIYNN